MLDNPPRQPPSFIELTRNEAKSIMLDLCKTPSQRRHADYLMQGLEERLSEDPRGNFRLMLIIAQVVAMLGADEKPIIS